MKKVKKVLTLLLILAIISQIFIPGSVKAQESVKAYDSNSLYDEVAKNAVLDNIKSKYVTSDTGIDFTKAASSTNGQGVYTIASTKDDLYPIHYYRGNIDNNNVLFGGFCWQIVRTTETGGVKLVYKGSPDENGKCENPKFDDGLQVKSVNSDSNAQYMETTSIYSSFKALNSLPLLFHILENGKLQTSSSTFYYSDKIEYDKDTNEYKLINYKLYNAGDNMGGFLYKLPSFSQNTNITAIYTCGNKEEKCKDMLLLTNTSIANGVTSFDYVILNNGNTLEKMLDRKITFGNDVEYKDGMYKLVNTIDVTILSINDNLDKILDGHHYFCDDYSNSCKNVNYVFGGYGDKITFVYSLALQDGLTADKIIANYKSRQSIVNSEVKEVIDGWYKSNMIDNTNYLEDTVWCNDRSRIFDYVFNKNSNLKNINQGFSMSLKCTNKIDEFTVDSKNGNGDLTYPTATLSAQEAIYAGNVMVKEENKDTNSVSSSYLDGHSVYTMTPYGFEEIREKQYVLSEGKITLSESKNIPSSNNGPSTSYYEFSIYPMISLKHSMAVSSGDGTPTNPYEVVEGNTVEYKIDGDMPKGFILPEAGSYFKGSKVKINSLKAGDVVDGYRFLGWTTEDVVIVGDTFDMPEKEVVFVGSFEKIEESFWSNNSTSIYLVIGIIAIAGLGFFFFKKKKKQSNENS